MELRVAAALKQPGEIFEAAMEQAFAPERYGGREIAFAAPVKLGFRYAFDGKAFSLTGSVEFALSLRCARCNEAFVQTLSIPLEERFVKGSAANDEEDSYAFDGDTLFLDQMVLDALFLHLPLQSVCGEDCRGLCPVCGVDLNKSQCVCAAEQVENPSPLSALGELLNDELNNKEV